MKPAATEEFALTAPEPKQLNAMDLLSIALQKDAAIDVIERLAALQEKSLAKQAEQSFFRSLHLAQEEVPSIEPNKEVKTGSGKLMYKYASYEQLDTALRPIYLKHGMGISFSGGDAPEGKVRVLCCVSHRDGHSERYQLDLAIDQGAAQLTKTDAELAAQSKAKRRILRNIFNVVDDLDDEVTTNAEILKVLDRFEAAKEWDHVDDPVDGPHAGLKQLYVAAYDKYEADPPALKIIVEAKKKIKKARGW